MDLEAMSLPPVINRDFQSTLISEIEPSTTGDPKGHPRTFPDTQTTRCLSFLETDTESSPNQKQQKDRTEAGSKKSIHLLTLSRECTI